MSENELQKLNIETYKHDVVKYRAYTETLSELNKKTKELNEKNWRISHSFLVGAGGLILFVIFGFLVFFLIHLIFGTSGVGSANIAFFSALFLFAFLNESLSSLWFNIISFGKFRNNLIQRQRTESQIKEIEELKNKVRETLLPFETIVSEHYKAQLADFFENNLYKKRSGGQEFEEALSEFSSMINEVSKINSTFITSKVFLWSYEEYLMKRITDHDIQTSKQSEELTSVRRFVRSVSEPQEPNREIVAPERLYRTARKIDWETLNKRRKLTGTRGEEIAMAVEQEYFESIGRNGINKTRPIWNRPPLPKGTLRLDKKGFNSITGCSCVAITNTVRVSPSCYKY
jgi:hypothetical protein